MPQMKTTLPFISLWALLILFFLACAPAGASERNPRWAGQVNLEHAKNFHRVTPDLYRSAQPSAMAMKSYAQFGIRTVINLRARHTDDAEAKGTGLVLVHIPTRTWKADSDATVVAALRAIREAEKPVLVHCMHGADRTGLVMAMYRMVEQGWTAEEALDEMQNGGFGFHSVWKHIPEYIRSVDPAAIRAALEADNESKP